MLHRLRGPEVSVAPGQGARPARVARRGRVALLGACALLAGCAIPRSPLLPPLPVPRTMADTIRAYQGRDLRLTLRDGRVEVLKGAVIEGDSVIGHWRQGPAGPRRAAVAVAEVVRVQRASRLIRAREIVARETSDAALVQYGFAVFMAMAFIGGWIAGLWP